MMAVRISGTFLLFFILNQQIWMSYEGDSFSILPSCVEPRNITIVVYMDVPFVDFSSVQWLIEHHLYFITKHLRYLVKSLFETSCLDLYVYSTVRKQKIQLNEENYVQVLGTEIQATNLFNGNSEIILSDVLPRNPKDEEHNKTLLFVNFWVNKDQETSIQEQKMIATKLNEAHGKNFDIILLCVEFSPLCTESREWLPQQSILYYDIPSLKANEFNPHLHLILNTLMKDPTFDWRAQYTRNAQFQCTKQSNRSSVYFWTLRDDVVEKVK